MKKLLFVIVLAAIGLAHYTRPPLEEHLRKVYLLANGPEAKFEAVEQSLPQWDGVEFKDWYILTATQDKEKKSLISVGFPRYVRVIDLDWGVKAFGKTPKND